MARRSGEGLRYCNNDRMMYRYEPEACSDQLVVSQYPGREWKPSASQPATRWSGVPLGRLTAALRGFRDGGLTFVGASQ